jgi:hypothetical protein
VTSAPLEHRCPRSFVTYAKVVLMSPGRVSTGGTASQSSSYPCCSCCCRHRGSSGRLAAPVISPLQQECQGTAGGQDGNSKMQQQQQCFTLSSSCTRARPSSAQPLLLPSPCSKQLNISASSFSIIAAVSSNLFFPSPCSTAQHQPLFLPSHCSKQLMDRTYQEIKDQSSCSATSMSLQTVPVILCMSDSPAQHGWHKRCTQTKGLSSAFTNLQT